MGFLPFAKTGVIKRGSKHVALLAIDIAASFAAIACTVLVAVPRFAAPQFWNDWALAAAAVAVSGAFIFYLVGLSRRFWRFVSIVDLTLIMFAVALHTAAIFVSLSALMGEAAPPVGFYVVEYVFAVSLMGLARVARRFGPQALVLARRALDGDSSSDGVPALIAGSPEAVERVLRKRELGVLNGFRPIGVLDTSDLDIRRNLCGVPILGGFRALRYVVNELAGTPNAVKTLIIASSAVETAEPEYVSLASSAADAGLNVIRAALSTSDEGSRIELKTFDLSELLGRPPVRLDREKTSQAIRRNTIAVTGAGGSIGSELVRQIAEFGPLKIVLLENCEYNLYRIELEIRRDFPNVQIAPVLCDIRDHEHVVALFTEHKPELVFHAAALKHVPLVELNPCMAVATNLLGTRHVADAARRCGAKAMIQVSTDKAVNPVGVMGATKRLGELYCQALDIESEQEADGSTRFFTVRFGNVLGSSGSVVPLFQQQLRDRMPLTVTHPEMTRYFMTIHEAVALVLHSAHSALAAGARRGRIFVLDMGEPIKVVDIANRMIRLSGLEPGVDAQITIIGTRPGEKLSEELFDSDERPLPSGIDGVLAAAPAALPLQQLESLLERLKGAVARREDEAVRKEIFLALNQPDALMDGMVPAENDAAPRARAASARLAVVGAR